MSDLAFYNKLTNAKRTYEKQSVIAVDDFVYCHNIRDVGQVQHEIDSGFIVKFARTFPTFDIYTCVLTREQITKVHMG